MRGNALFKCILFFSIVLHVLVITRVSMPRGFFENKKISIDYLLPEGKKTVAAKPAPESGKDRQPEEKAENRTSKKEPKHPETISKPPSIEKPAADRSDRNNEPEKEAAALPAPPPNPLPENSITAMSGVMETASVDPGAPAGLKGYNTETKVPAGAFVSPDGVIGGRGTGDTGTSQPEKKTAPGIDTAAVIRDYGAKVRALIERRKKYPERARRLGIQGEVNLEFAISAEGRLIDSKVSRSSGSDIIDEAALQAVRAAAPFPPLPGALGLDRLKLTVKLVYKYE